VNPKTSDLIPNQLDESPGSVHGKDGFCICINTNTVRENSNKKIISTFFECQKAAKCIKVSIMNSNIQVPRDFSISRMISPSGKVFTAAMGATQNGCYSLVHPYLPSGICAMGITNSILEFGLWRVDVEEVLLPPMTSNFSLRKDLLSTEKDSLWVLCTVHSNINFRRYGRDIYNKCCENNYCRSWLQLLKFPIGIETSDPHIQWERFWFLFGVIPIASLFVFGTASQIMSSPIYVEGLVDFYANYGVTLTTDETQSIVHRAIRFAPFGVIHLGTWLGSLLGICDPPAT